MIKNILKCAIFSISAIALSSCSSNKKDKPADTRATKTETTVTSPTQTEPTKKENAPESITYTINPDTAILGKTREAFVKVTEAKAINLQDAEGKSTGSEITFKLSITNKSRLDNKKYFSVSNSDARLEMDNGNAIQASNATGSSSPDPESTSQSEWTFQLPVGAKPTKLNFFLDGTRVSVGLEKK